ncbi:ATP-binding protein, partial [Streptomyces sp. NPDC055078]
PAGPAAPRAALLERDGERERLTELLARGRTVRLTGAPGSGRTALLHIVAQDCAGLAPDGVVRLNGHHRTPTDLLYELFAAVHTAPRHRPGRAALLAQVREIGAIVVLDDLEFGGAALGELLDAAPECAFLLAATPDVPAPADDAQLEEIALAGLGRAASAELLRRAVDRPLTEDETNWAGDLWFESEGLPLRFVQAGALLRQCDRLREQLADDPDAFEAFTPDDAAEGNEVPLPTLGQGAAPVALLASRLSRSARQALRFAVALGGELPHQAHLPALIDDTHADSAIGELLGCGLLSPIGRRYRLAAGVLVQLTEKGYADEAATHARTAAQHYAWWAGHPSVAPERAAAEADAVLAALTALVPGRGALPAAKPGGPVPEGSQGEAGHPSAAVLLARTAAPAFAAGLNWGAWERVLRVGSEAARIAGEVAEEAYFHHELGILALCTDNLDRARAELEASIGLRGALSDKSGTVAGRRALALVDDRENGLVPVGSPKAATTADGSDAGPVSRPEEPSPPSHGVSTALPVLYAVPVRPVGPEPGSEADTQAGAVVPETLVSPEPPYRAPGSRRRALLGGTRRNLVAASTGALLVAVLGTVVTLGATSDSQDPPGSKVRDGQSANEDDTQDGLNADEPDDRKGGDGPREPAGVPGQSGSATPSGGPSPDSSPSPTGDPSSSGTSRPGTSGSPDGPTSTPTGKPSSPTPPKPPTSSKPPTSKPPTSKPPTSTPPSSPAPSTSSAPTAIESSASAPITPTSAAPSTEPSSSPSEAETASSSPVV